MPCTCPFYCFPTLQYFVLLVFVSLYCSCTVYCVLHLQCIYVLLYIQYLPVLPLSKHFYAPIYFTYRSSSPIFRSSLYNVHYLAAKPCVLHICRGFLYCTVPVLPAYDHQISLPPDCANSRLFLLSCLLFYYFWGLAILIFEFLLLVFRAIAQKTRRVPISGGKCTEAYSLPRPSDS